MNIDGFPDLLITLEMVLRSGNENNLKKRSFVLVSQPCWLRQERQCDPMCSAKACRFTPDDTFPDV